MKHLITHYDHVIHQLDSFDIGALVLYGGKDLFDLTPDEMQKTIDYLIDEMGRVFGEIIILIHQLNQEELYEQSSELYKRLKIMYVALMELTTPESTSEIIDDNFKLFFEDVSDKIKELIK